VAGDEPLGALFKVIDHQIPLAGPGSVHRLRATSANAALPQMHVVVKLPLTETNAPIN